MPPTIAAGELLLLTTGEYSDYDVKCLVCAVREFTLDDMQACYFQDHPEQMGHDDDEFEYAQFIHWLLEHGYVEEVRMREWHLGAYHEWIPTLHEPHRIPEDL